MKMLGYWGIFRIFIALARVSTDSWCLPALWRASPSARNFLTSAICCAESAGFFASASSIFFMSAGQWKANAEALASMSAPNRAARRIFIQFSFKNRGTPPPAGRPRCQHVNATGGKPIPAADRIAGAGSLGKFWGVAVRRRRRVESRHMNSLDFVPDETWLRSRFVGCRTVEPVAAGDGHLWRSDREIRPAAVLVPVV